MGNPELNSVGKLADALDDRQVTRRDFVGHGLKIGLSIPLMGSVLAACGDPEDGSTDDVASESGQASGGSSGTDTITVLGIGVVLQDFQNEQFTADTGYEIVPVVDTLTGQLTKMLTEPQNYDVVDQNATYLQPMVDAGVIQPISVSDVANWENARPLFTDADTVGAVDGWPISQIYTDDSQAEFSSIPTFYNYEAMGYNADAIDGEVLSYSSLFDPQYAGQVALWNDAVWTIGLAANYLVKEGTLTAPANGLGNLSTEEIDQVIAVLSERKAEGQFRAFWSDYGQSVNLMASEEILISDAWNPAFEDAKAQSGLDLRYINPVEGNRPWFTGISLSVESENYDAVAALSDWRLDGWFGGSIAPLGYYSPTTNVEDAMDAETYELWYGDGRFAGNYQERTENIAYWPGWPENYDYYLSSWSAFLAS